MRKLFSILIAGGVSLIMAVAASADVTPTNIWTDFYGSATSYNGQPIPVGSVIDAYDPDGVHCGSAVVRDDGHYGFMPVYGDELSTEQDEGAVIDDPITFYINGRMAVPEGPDANTWLGKGGQVELNLSASAEVGMEPVTDVDQYYAVPGDTVHITAMVKNIGEGIDFYTVSGTTEHGWIVKPMLGFVYAMPGEAVLVEFDVYVPVAIFSAMNELVDFRISSGVDASVYIDNQANIQVDMPTEVDDDDQSMLPGGYELYQNYPNPFNPTTTLSFDLPNRADVSLEVFDILGRSVKEYRFENLDAGNHSVEFDGQDLASGIYFYRLQADQFSAMKKMVLLK